MTNKYHKEHQLLLFTCSWSLFELNKDRVAKLVSASLNWEYIFYLSQKHRIHPNFLKLLATSSLDKNIPEKYYQIFQIAYEIEITQSLIKEQHFKKALSAFNHSNLNVTLLKGIVLKDLIWNGYCRPMGDIDIFIDKKDIELCKKILRSEGYNTNSEVNSNFAENVFGEIIFNHKKVNFLEIEVSTQYNKKPELKPIYDLNEDWMQAELVPVDFHNHRVFKLNPYKEFQFLLYHHVSLNHLNKLLYLGDMLEYVIHFKNNLDWEKIYIDSKSRGQIKAFSVLNYFTTTLLKFSIKDGKTIENKATFLPSKLHPYYNNSEMNFIDLEQITLNKNRVRWHLLPNIIKKAKYIIRRLIPSIQYASWRCHICSEKHPLLIYYHYFSVQFTLLFGDKQSKNYQIKKSED